MVADILENQRALDLLQIGDHESFLDLFMLSALSLLSKRRILLKLRAKMSSNFKKEILKAWLWTSDSCLLSKIINIFIYSFKD